MIDPSIPLAARPLTFNLGDILTQATQRRAQEQQIAASKQLEADRANALKMAQAQYKADQTAQALQGVTDEPSYQQALKMVPPDVARTLPTSYDPAMHRQILGHVLSVKEFTDLTSKEATQKLAQQAQSSTEAYRQQTSQRADWAETRAEAAAKSAAEDKLADNARADAALKQAADLAKQAAEARVAAAKVRGSSTAQDTTPLSPAGLDMAALNYKKTGMMPALGMGDKTTRKTIIDRAAQLTPADMDRISAGVGDIAANRADYRADSGSLAALQKQRDAITSFEKTASKNIDLFLTQAGKVVDTGSPLANTAVRAITGKLIGSPDQAAFDAARQVAINEIAKITSNPTLSGTLSDSARHEVEAFNPKNATLKQSVAVMRLLKQDMANRTTSLDETLAATRKRLGGMQSSTANGPDLTGLTQGHGRTFNSGPYAGQTWTIGADGKPAQVK